MWKIIKSRFTKQKEDKEILRKRKICKGCEYNSLNMEKIPLNKLALKKISDFYSLITGRSDEDILGNCEACSSCSVYYKTAFEEQCPHPIEDRWKQS